MNAAQVGRAPLKLLLGRCTRRIQDSAGLSGFVFHGLSGSSVIYRASCKLIFSLLGPQKSLCIPKHICTLKTNTFSLVATGVCKQARARLFWACFQENNLLFLVRSVKLSGMISFFLSFFFLHEAGQVNPKKAEDFKPCLQRWPPAGLIWSIKVKRSSQICIRLGRL